MSSHLVPALRALLPVAFLCEVRVATRLSSFPITWYAPEYVCLSMTWPYVAVGRSIYGWIRTSLVVRLTLGIACFGGANKKDIFALVPRTRPTQEPTTHMRNAPNQVPSGRSYLLALSGSELLLLSFTLAAVRLRCLFSPIFLLSWSSQASEICVSTS